MKALGIDLGGSGFRLGVFDTRTGTLEGPLHACRHGSSTAPNEVLPSLVQAIEGLGWRGPIGLGFPGAVEASKPITAPNLGDAWLETEIASVLHNFHGGHFSMLNDADAVAVAEERFGAGHDEHSCVLTLTIGTGLGTTVHQNGALLPNLEYGRLPHPSREGCLEHHLSGAARTQHGWTLEQWAVRFQEGLTYLEQKVRPTRIILYGGLMEHWERIQPLLKTEAELVPSLLADTAGPLGAALFAASHVHPL